MMTMIAPLYNAVTRKRCDGTGLTEVAFDAVSWLILSIDIKMLKLSAHLHDESKKYATKFSS